MQKLIFKSLIILTFVPFLLKGQSYYFPSKTGVQWDTISPNRLGWCDDSIASLNSFLENKNTKSFIVLKDGKIVYEKYFGTFVKDSFWYWASAGKTIVASLVGIAQNEGILNIQDSSSKYLGRGWTSCTNEQERKITIRNQLTMSTGLKENIINLDCKTPSCLTFKADAGSRWYYYNATYLLLHDVIENASGLTLQQYTNTRLLSKIGMGGAWFNGVYYSKTRDMAKFGSMILNKGIWNSDTIIKDRNYFNEMVNTSQNLNLSYGYLFWLNGKSSFILPSSPVVFNQTLAPDAPLDMFAALGKNDQKIHIIPSQNMVVIRMGNSAETASAGPSSFDNNLWIKLKNMSCKTSVNQTQKQSFSIYPNPSVNNQFFVEANKHSKYEVVNLTGKILLNGEIEEGINQIKHNLVSGIYFVKINNSYSKLIVEN